MLDNLTEKFNLPQAGAIAITTFTLVPLYTLMIYFTPNTYKTMATFFINRFTQKSTPSIGNTPSNPEKEKLQRDIKYMEYALIASIPFAFMAFTPTEFLFKTHMLPLLNKTAQSILLPIFFPLTIIGTGGFMMTGSLRLFQRYKGMLITKHATEHDNAQAYINKVMIPHLIKFLETHPSNFSFKEVQEHSKKILAELMLAIEEIAYSQEASKNGAIYFSKFKKSLKQRFLSQQRNAFFAKQGKVDLNPAITVSIADDSNFNNDSKNSEDSLPKKRGCLDICRSMCLLM